MADISLLFDVATGGNPSGNSEETIRRQLETIVANINQKPFSIKFQADESSLQNFQKRISETLSSIGAGASTNGFAQVTNQINVVASAVHTMNSAVNETNLNKISTALINMSGANISSGAITDIISRLESLNITLTDANVQFEDLGKNGERVPKLIIQGVDAAGNSIRRNLRFDKNGELKKDLTDIGIKLADIKTKLKSTGDTTKKNENKLSDTFKKAKNDVTDYYNALTKLHKDGLNNVITQNDENTWVSSETGHEERVAQLNRLTTIYQDATSAQKKLTVAEREALTRHDTNQSEKYRIAAEDIKKQAESQKGATKTTKTYSDAFKTAKNSVTDYYRALTKLHRDGLNNVITQDKNGVWSASEAGYEERVAQLNRLSQGYKDAMASQNKLTAAEQKAFTEHNAGRQSKYNVVVEDLKRQAENQQKVINTTRSYSQTINSCRENLKKWTSAETSKHESSRVAYNELKNQVAAAEEARLSYENSEMSLEEYTEAINKLKNTNIATKRTLIENGDASKALGERLVGLAKKFTSWLSVSQVVMHLYRGLRKMVDSVKEVDAAMTELKKVTDATDATYNKFLDSAITRAKKFGSTLVDTISATSDFARLGYDIGDASLLADAAIVYKNVGDGIEDIETASESIIATMQAFNISPENIMSIVDKFNAIGNNYAISSGGVGEAILRSAAALNAANNTLDETMALIAAANTITQDPDKVGTTLKTVSMFLRAAKTEAEEAGESTEGMANSVSELRNEILALTGQKVDIQIDDNTFKSTYQILKELSLVWSDLTDTTQANITELVGGKRNSNVVSALLENFSVAEAAVETSAKSSGSALAENEKQLESINGKISLFQAEFQNLSQTIFKSEDMKRLIDAGTGLISLLNTLLSIGDGLVLKVGLVYAAFALFKTLNIKSKITGYFGSFVNLRNMIDGVSLCMREGFTATQTLKVGFSSLFEIIKAHPILTAVAAFSALLSIIDGVNRAQEEAVRKIEEDAEKSRAKAETITEEHKALSKLIEEYKAISTSNKSDVDKRAEIIEVQEQINNLIGDQSERIDLVNGKLQTQLATLKDIKNETMDDDIATIRTAYNDARNSTNTNDFKKVGLFENLYAGKSYTLSYDFLHQFDHTKGVHAESEVRKAISDIMESHGGSLYGKDYFTLDFGNINDFDFNSRINILDEILNKIQTIKDYDIKSSKLFKELTVFRDDLKEDYNLQVKQGESLINALSENYTNKHNGHIDSLDDYTQFRSKLIEQIKNDSTVSDMLTENIFDNSALTKVIDDYLSTLDEFSKYYDEWFNKFGSETAKGIAKIRANWLSNENQDENTFARIKKTLAAMPTETQFDQWINTLSDTDREMVYTISLETDTAKYSLQDWQKTLEDYKSNNNNIVEESAFSKLMSEKGTDDAPAFSERVDAYVDKINTLNETLTKFQSGEFNNSDFVELTKEFPSLAGNATDLNTAILNLVDSLKTDISKDFQSQANKMSTSEDIERLNAYKDAVLSLSDSMTDLKTSSSTVISEIEKISSTYKTIFDSIDEYNKTGILSTDTFKALVQLEPKYINSLVSENGQLKLNKESYIELTKAQLENYKISKALEEINIVKGLQTIEEANNHVASLNIESVETMADALDSQWQQLYAEAQLKDATQGTTAFTDAVLNSYQYINKHNSIVDKYSKSLDGNADAAFGAAEANESYKESLEKQKEAHEKNKEVLENNKSALEDLISLTQDYIKQIKEDEKEALEERKEAMQEQIDAEIELLDKEKERADFEKSLAEKQNNLSKANLSLISASLDDSSVGKKNYKEAQDEYNEANSEMTEFLSEHNYDIQKEALESYKETQEEYYDGLIKTIDEYLDNEVQLYKDACEMIDNDNGTLYSNLLGYVQTYTTKTNSEFNHLWDNAKTALTQYNDLHYSTFDLMDYLQGAIYTTESIIKGYEEQIDSVGSAIGNVGTNISDVATSINDSADSLANFNQKYNDFLKGFGYKYGLGYSVNGVMKPYWSKSGDKVTAAQEIAKQISEDLKDAGGTHSIPWYAIYGNLNKFARGTKSAIGGLSIVDEEGLGSELIPKPVGGGRYTILPQGNPVFSKSMTNELFDFSNDPGSYLINLMSRLKDSFLPSLGDISKGIKQTNVANAPNVNINIQGNADASTVRALRQEANNIIKQATEASMRNIINVVDRNNFANR